MRLRAIRVGVGLVFASIGCRQIVGFDQRTPGNYDAGIDAEAGAYVSSSGKWPFADPECMACIDQSCAKEANDCALDPSCQARELCVAACPREDKPCPERCLVRVPSAVLSQETWPLSHCVADKCRMECPSSVVTLPNGTRCGPLRGKVACITCCCQEFADCDADSDCGHQIACGRQCSPVNGDGPFDNTCFEACTGQLAPLNPNLNIGACAMSSMCVGSGSCRAVDWSCLGGVWPVGGVWPPKPSPAARKLYGTVLNLPDSVSDMPTPLRGFHVKMCSVQGAFVAQGTSGLDLCPGSPQEEVSNEFGNVVLDLNALGGIREMPGFTSYFEVTPPQGLDYPKHLFFLPEWTLTHSVHKNFYVSLRDSRFSLPPSDPGHGGVVFFAHDCSQVLHLADGVEVAADPAGSGPTYSLPGLVPDRSLKSTSPAGIGIITNLPAGPVKLFTKRHDTGDPIGTTTIVIESDATTVVDLVPMPPDPP
jgi:hypothetical protein